MGLERFLPLVSVLLIIKALFVNRTAFNKRLAKVNVWYAKGFVYCFSRQDTTGAKKTLNPKLASYISQVKKVFPCPVAVGFGISQKDHLISLRTHADVAVIGSVIVDIISKDFQNYSKNVQKFLRSLE